MRFTDEAIESLVESNYQIECIFIQLTRQEGDGTFGFAGPGSIRQNEDGQLLLKCYHIFDDDDGLFRAWTSSLGEALPGEIVPDNTYFRMEALDMEGNTWKAENVSIHGHFSIQANGVVIESKIREIRAESERVAHATLENSSLYMIIPGCHSVPCNEWEDMGSKKTMSVCRIKWSESEIRLNVRSNFLFVRINGPSALLDPSIPHRMAEALSIAFGKVCHIVLTNYCADQVCISAITTLPKTDTNKQIPSPIKCSDPWDYLSFETFIKCYLSSVKQPYGLYYEYWHRINRAWQGGIEIAALAVTTAIEGLLKESFSEYLEPDEEFKRQAEIAKTAISSLDVGNRIKDYLSSSLGNASTGSAKNGLRNLRDRGLITNQSIKCWSELRNKATHADSLELEGAELQRYLDLVFGCYHLFNLLFLIKIGFTGNYSNLSIKGWPTECMKVVIRDNLEQDA